MFQHPHGSNLEEGTACGSPEESHGRESDR